MFKSIQYRLLTFTVLLMLAVAALTYFTVRGEVSFAIISGIATIICLYNMHQHYKKFNSNVLFLLNALDNGDYSFHFSEDKLSRREKELNVMLNRIKEILVGARKEVVENEKFLSLIIESVSTGIIIMDEKGHVQTVNQSALDLMGLPVFTHINQLSNVNEAFPDLFRNLRVGDNPRIEVSNEREEMQVSLSLSEIVIKRGRMKVITLNNIGNELEAKEMESWIRLIRVMTHEIMNSIAPITSLSETLLTLHNMPENDSSEEDLRLNTIEAFETIHSTAKGLLSFVDSYRKFTAIPKPNIRSFEVKPLIDKILHLEEKCINEKNIQVELREADEHTEWLADEKLITQVLVNLVKNAVEAITDTELKRIRISINRLADGKVQVEVSNTGNPIPKEVLPHIFIPFFTTKDSGTGIGLSISRYIMRLHGGKLTHTTSAEGWTVFTVMS
ncbi:multi-sensor signal transduction histidine kinase [Paludibacter propionicigenes WB4]|uniref:histidine kinase n=1 Tax=Paludibacter propionicigenes (strain DSM 17365 / JCM 13257 / WB4) TaxID=694427 RepID=E4T0H0_PALPW|nr:ATP-binding protein [Paludibacter propionicigenes]ADQ78329.1 multi-sensor signal transduction histidine kinase [Paludibacter propionicigenes WB4]